MTPQEEAMLNDLIDRVDQTQLTEKDPEAEQLLIQRLGRNPNALYILAQTVLVQKYALDQATAQINQLRQAPQPAHTTSFLGNLLGLREAAPPAPPPLPPPGYGQPPYGQPSYGQPWGQAPSYGAPPPQQGGGSSFLRTAATTAAGVAAGALAFQGIESLLHGFGQPSGFGGGGSFGGGAPEEIITNNYYDDAGRGLSEGHHEHVDSSSLSDSGSDAANLQQASDNLRDDGVSGDAALDDASYDDSSFDDFNSSGDDLS